MSISKGLWCKIKPGILFLAMLSRLCVPFIMVFRFLISTGPFLLLSAKCERLSFSTIFFPCYFPFFFRNRESIMEHFWWDTIILKKKTFNKSEFSSCIPSCHELLSNRMNIAKGVSKMTKQASIWQSWPLSWNPTIPQAQPYGRDAN